MYANNWFLRKCLERNLIPQKVFNQDNFFRKEREKFYTYKQIPFNTELFSDSNQRLILFKIFTDDK